MQEIRMRACGEIKLLLTSDFGWFSGRSFLKRQRKILPVMHVANDASGRNTALPSARGQLTGGTPFVKRVEAGTAGRRAGGLDTPRQRRESVEGGVARGLGMQGRVEPRKASTAQDRGMAARPRPAQGERDVRPSPRRLSGNSSVNCFSAF